MAFPGPRWAAVEFGDEGNQAKEIPPWFGLGRAGEVVKSPGSAWVNEALSVSGWGGGRWIGGALERGEEQGQGRGSIPTCVCPLLLG